MTSRSKVSIQERGAQRQLYKSQYEGFNGPLADVTLEDLERMDEFEAQYLLRQRMIKLPKIGTRNAGMSKSVDVTAKLQSARES